MEYPRVLNHITMKETDCCHELSLTESFAPIQMIGFSRSTWIQMVCVWFAHIAKYHFDSSTEMNDVQSHILNYFCVKLWVKSIMQAHGRRKKVSKLLCSTRSHTVWIFTYSNVRCSNRRIKVRTALIEHLHRMSCSLKQLNICVYTFLIRKGSGDNEGCKVLTSAECVAQEN